MDPLLVAGLGNPGDEYAESRHNVGYHVVDELIRRFRTRFRPGKGEYLEASILVGSGVLVLLKPVTFMNNSGIAVGEALARYGLPPSRSLVVVDDFQLLLGRIRIRPAGSDGGHNGLSSIIYQLQSDSFPRIRCGIGRVPMPAKEDRRAFVLSPFERDEREAAAQMIARAADAVLELAQSGIASAMNTYNT